MLKTWKKTKEKEDEHWRQRLLELQKLNENKDIQIQENIKRIEEALLAIATKIDEIEKEIKK